MEAPSRASGPGPAGAPTGWRTPPLAPSPPRALNLRPSRPLIMAKKKSTPSKAPAPRKRRGIEDRIAALEAQIARIREREARRKAKSDPALRQVAIALKAVDKALATIQDEQARTTLDGARANLRALLRSDAGAAPSRETGRARRSPADLQDLGETLLGYVRSHPGLRGEQIAEALATDAATIRPVMKRLIEAGQVRTSGQRRGMTYTAV